MPPKAFITFFNTQYTMRRTRTLGCHARTMSPGRGITRISTEGTRRFSHPPDGEQVRRKMLANIFTKRVKNITGRVACPPCRRHTPLLCAVSSRCSFDTSGAIYPPKALCFLSFPPVPCRALKLRPIVDLIREPNGFTGGTDASSESVSFFE